MNRGPGHIAISKIKRFRHGWQTELGAFNRDPQVAG